MGYSYSIRCRDEEAQRKVLEVLNQHKPYSEVTGKPEQEQLLFHDEISVWNQDREVWEEDALMVGVEATSLGGDAFGQYYWTLLRWAALKAGERVTAVHFDDEVRSLPKPCPYTLYDGRDMWPIYLDSDPELKGVEPLWCHFDEQGIQIDEGLRIERVGGLLFQIPEFFEHLRDSSDVAATVRKQGYTHVVDAIYEGIRAEIKRLDAFW